MEANKLHYAELENKVSELKHRVQELSLLLEEAQRNSRYNTLHSPEVDHKLNSELIESVIHKIKTPLDTIVGLSKLLCTAKLDLEEKNKFAEIITNCSNELQSVFSEFVSFNSLKQNEIVIENEKVSLNELFDDLKVKFVDQVFFNGLTLKSVKGLSDEDDTVIVDKNIVRQVLASLLSNSLKFTRRGFIEMGYQVVHNRIRFYVKDSGVGFDEKFQEKLTSSDGRIERIANDETEVGLGLSTAKHLVYLLGGDLKAESKSGIGTIFYFDIPYVPTTVDAIQEKEDKKIIKVLIADDEEISFMLLKKLMERGNVEIIRAKNGEEAYEIYKNNPDINLILMDLKMPQVDGYVAAQLIKNEAPEIPIIAQSSYSLKDNKENHERAFNDYLSKPVNKEEFEAVINKYINRSFLN
ncbi:response regulator [Flavobacterium sp. H122]|uniref:response regulator n=1 Tax=Flavobacterium sp. H122 TaxID=2529860 RepID=UPI0010AB424E|nr:response regulator [Flavobacterium sp. H122]